LVYRLRLLPVIWYPAEALSETFDGRAEAQNCKKKN
jgi:hypothetical protein